jgi:hypothetical protein
MLCISLLKLIHQVQDQAMVKFKSIGDDETTKHPPPSTICMELYFDHPDISFHTKYYMIVLMNFSMVLMIFLVTLEKTA